VKLTHTYYILRYALFQYSPKKTGSSD
jgi:hypothetical protein